MKIQQGQTLQPFTVQTIKQKPLLFPNTDSRFVHLQFRRFSGCPICNLHLRSFTKRKAELVAAGIREVIFFHSSESEMRKYQKDVPFDLIADPDKVFYKHFGVEKSAFASMHPSAFFTGLRGALMGFISTKSEGGTHGLPADFLLNQQGVVVAVKYGAHANDQWSVAQVLGLTRAMPVALG